MSKTSRVILDIVPRRIEPADWAEAYDDAHKLLVAHPARLLGYDWRTIAGVPLPVYTRVIERDVDEPTARRWCVAGERASLAMGECQVMYRDLARYMTTTPEQVPSPGLEDILLAVADAAPEVAAELPGRVLPAHPVPSPGCAPRVGQGNAVARPRDGFARVLGDATSPAPYRMPLLAAAMVVEARFPRQAMVHGDVDREQAKAARRWAEGVLGRPIALPVRVDAWRVAERLGSRLESQALVCAVERLHLAPPEKKATALFGIFARAEAEAWWLGKLREHAHPAVAPALRLLTAYLEATCDLGRLCVLACQDERGPRYAPAALMEALASLRRQNPPGHTRQDDATVEEALRVAFGATAVHLAALLRRHDGAPSAAPSESAAPTRSAEAILAAELDGLATVPPGDLSPVQRAHVDALVGALRRGAEAPPAEGALYTIAELLTRAGPTLTEDAWDWMGREQDAELLRFLTLLAAVDDISASFGRVRRALFENRGLCCYALGLFRAAAS